MERVKIQGYKDLIGRRGQQVDGLTGDNIRQRQAIERWRSQDSIGGINDSSHSMGRRTV